MKTAIACLAVLVAASSPLTAQSERLEGRFAAPVVMSLRAIVDSAQAEGLPTEPLVNSALQGSSRNVDPIRVVAAVRALRGRLAVARSALGPGASASELVAAATAVAVGVSPTALTDIRRTQPSASLLLRLVVLTDMVDRGVAADTAANIILSLGRAGVRDEEYQALRQSFLLDIRSGAPPSAAAVARARGILIREGVPPVPPARTP